MSVKREGIYSMLSQSATINTKFLKVEVHQILLLLVICAGVFARVYKFGQIPNGINQDEAFAGYEAWSLLKYGVDYKGYSFPVYLAAWDSGMNALETYLMMPFIALFGLNAVTVRLPQLIVGCLSILVIYLLLRRIEGKQTALLAAFAIAICPWHIMLCRWGLESNLAPGFFLFGLYFFVLATDNSKYLPLSTFMYGLSLYTYATVWIFVPFIVLSMVAYCMVHKKLHCDKHLIWAVVIIIAEAFPLILFLAVNYGFIDEIVTSYISIPKLTSMRASEISFTNISGKMKLLYNVFIKQSDGYIWNSPTKFGLFYRISIPFSLLGIICCFTRILKSIKSKAFTLSALPMIQFVLCLPLCLLVNANANRVNIIILPTVIFAAIGINWLIELKAGKFVSAIMLIYVVMFIGFVHYYFTEYDMESREAFSYGLEEAISIASEKGDTIFVDQNEYFIKVLFYAQTPADVVQKTGEYLYYPSSKEYPLKFGRYYFYIDSNEPDYDAAYILPVNSDIDSFTKMGFTTKRCGNYYVLYHK